MNKIFRYCAIAGLLTGMSIPAIASSQDNRAYAILQDCLASAELDANLGSQLDRYCIDSYLATVTDSD